jgi:hypothetical protein
MLAAVFDYQLSGSSYYLPSPHKRLFSFKNHRQHFTTFPKKVSRPKELISQIWWYLTLPP